MTKSAHTGEKDMIPNGVKHYLYRKPFMCDVQDCESESVWRGAFGQPKFCKKHNAMKKDILMKMDEKKKERDNCV